MSCLCWPEHKLLNTGIKNEPTAGRVICESKMLLTDEKKEQTNYEMFFDTLINFFLD